MSQAKGVSPAVAVIVIIVVLAIIVGLYWYFLAKPRAKPTPISPEEMKAKMEQMKAKMMPGMMKKGMPPTQTPTPTPSPPGP